MTPKNGFPFRGLEIHSRRLLQQKHIDWALDFCGKYSLNTLILHNNDLCDMLVFPEKFVDSLYAMEQHSVRRLFITNDELYMKNVARGCKAKRIELYLETKEIYFGDGIIQACPEVLNDDGTICPSHPFWFEFVEEKIREVVDQVLPDLSGLIVSIGSRESLISFIKNQCTCERCKKMGLAGWYENIIASLYRPLARTGKKLVIRDFSFQRENAEMLMNAVNKASPDIIMALKYVPQDYFPQWPNNPKIGDKEGHPQYIEYDTWGQFFGFGYFPVSIVEDLRERLRFAYEKDADGVWFRTDWEGLQETSVYNSMNELNLIGGAMLANDIDTAIDTIYEAWKFEGLKNPEIPGSYEQPYCTPKATDALIRLKQFMQESWKIMDKAIYARGGNLFHFCCRFPDSLYWVRRTMFRMSMLDSYSPGAFARVTPTDENIAEILKEKKEALEMVKKLPAMLDVHSLGLPDDFTGYLERMLELYELYVEGWNVVTPCYFYVSKAEETRKEQDTEEAEKWITKVYKFSVRFRSVMDKAMEYSPHYLENLLDPRKTFLFADDCKRTLDRIRKNLPPEQPIVPKKYSFRENERTVNVADPNMVIKGRF